MHAARGDLRVLRVHAAPIDLSSPNPVSDLEADRLSYETMAAGRHPTAEGGTVYARWWNPTGPGSRMARLAGTAEAAAVASGMATMTAVVPAAAQAGRDTPTSTTTQPGSSQSLEPEPYATQLRSFLGHQD
jgi:methionine-gamma-lyase